MGRLDALLRDVTPARLQDPAYWIELGGEFPGDLQHNAVTAGGMALHALRVGRNPGALFRTNILAKRNHTADADDAAAHEALKRHQRAQGGAGVPHVTAARTAPAAPATTPTTDAVDTTPTVDAERVRETRAAIEAAGGVQAWLAAQIGRSPQ